MLLLCVGFVSAFLGFIVSIFVLRRYLILAGRVSEKYVLLYEKYDALYKSQDEIIRKYEDMFRTKGDKS